MRRLLVGFCGFFLLFAALSGANAQPVSAKIARIDIKHVGPQAVSDELVRGNIRIKPGDAYLRVAVDDDVRSLYSTGLFYNIRVADEMTPQGVVLTYVVQGNPRLAEIKFEGNHRFGEKKLRKKLTAKTGEPFNERKLFTDTQEIQKLYQKSGYPRTEVKYSFTIEEASGRATAVFQIKETPKVRIENVEFVGAKAFKQKKLRKVIKTRRHWMFSWLTGSGFLKDEQFEDDQEKLKEYYRDHGYIDFEIKDVQIINPSPTRMIIRFIVFEGSQYKIGSIQFTGNDLFTTNQIAQGLHSLRRTKAKQGPHGLEMDVGDTFTPKGFTRDIEQVEDFYGAKGYIDVSSSTRNLSVTKIPNTETGTMDLEFKIKEGQKAYIERIEIKGNTKTKDKVIRRELAVSPGEVFDMVKVRISKQRLEGLQYFEKVDTRPEGTEVPNHKNLVVGVDEKNTGNLTMGAGFSSVDAVIGFVEVSQGNFDLFHPPTFTGGGQKFRLRVQLGTERQDYLASFIEPWFLGQKLSLGIDAYHRELSFVSPGSIYDESRTGARLSLTRALWSDFFIGTISYTMEDVGILLNSGFHGPLYSSTVDPGSPYGTPAGPGGPGPGPPVRLIPQNVPTAILDERGHHLLSRVGFSIARDTRNSPLLPDKGQRTELFGEIVGGALGGDKEFYKLELRTAWYFKGFMPGHILEVVGRTGIADAFGDSQSVPFYERYYLGGLYSLRGFRYRGISPRETGFGEPIGGDTSWFGSAEYSVPIIERLRFAVFYDVGDVESKAYQYNFENFNDNWGVGLRLNLPIGPLRLDYGIPITHDHFNSGSGRFQFGVGYTREF